MPRKLRELIADLESAGFREAGGGKGSHRKFKHPAVAKPVILSGKVGQDARQYQEKDIARAINVSK